MKRIGLSLLLTMILISSTVLSYADAENINTPTGNAPLESSIKTEGIKDDPLFGEIKVKYEQLVLLRSEQRGILEQIKSVTAANVALEKQLKDGYKRDKYKDQTKIKDQFAVQSTQLKSLMDQRKALLDQLKQLMPVKPEKPVRPAKIQKPVNPNPMELPSEPGLTEPSAVTEIPGAAIPLGSADAGAEIQALKEQITSLTTQIKEKAQALKNAKDEAVAGKEASNPLGENIKNAHGQITALRAQIDAARAAIERIQVDKSQEWALFKADMEMKNLTDASAHMSTILEMKQEIINKLNEILNMKQEINEILTDLVSEIPTPGESAVPADSLRVPAPDFIPGELEAPTV